MNTRFPGFYCGHSAALLVMWTSVCPSVPLPAVHPSVDSVLVCFTLAASASTSLTRFGAGVWLGSLHARSAQLHTPRAGREGDRLRLS